MSPKRKALLISSALFFIQMGVAAVLYFTETITDLKRVLIIALLVWVLVDEVQTTMQIPMTWAMAPEKLLFALAFCIAIFWAKVLSASLPLFLVFAAFYMPIVDLIYTERLRKESADKEKTWPLFSILFAPQLCITIVAAVLLFR
jgi:hypothetical protein